MAYNTEKFEKGLEELGISLSEEQIGQFLTYYEMLVEKNKVMNLTAITSSNSVIAVRFITLFLPIMKCSWKRIRL